MPETLLAGLPDGAFWLAAATFTAGVVRGFSGFGSAMILMPVAAAVLPPVQALTFVTAAELLGPVPNLRQAARQADLRELLHLIAAAALALPLGLWALRLVPPDAFGWLISAVVLGLLMLVISGWRYRGVLRQRMVTGIGALGGFLTGFVGMPGPPVVMLYLARPLPEVVVRAHLMLYLFAVDLLLFPLLWLTGLIVWPVLGLGAAFGALNALGNLMGRWLFSRRPVGAYRFLAYIAILCSALIGLPIWKG